MDLSLAIIAFLSDLSPVLTYNNFQAELTTREDHWLLVLMEN